MLVINFIITLLIVALSYVISAIAFVIRIAAVGLLEMHLFLEWCMCKLVDVVDKIDSHYQ